MSYLDAKLFSLISRQDRQLSAGFTLLCRQCQFQWINDWDMHLNFESLATKLVMLWNMPWQSLFPRNGATVSLITLPGLLHSWVEQALRAFPLYVMSCLSCHQEVPLNKELLSSKRHKTHSAILLNLKYSRKLMGLVQKSVMVEILWSKKAKSAGVLL